MRTKLPALGLLVAGNSRLDELERSLK